MTDFISPPEGNDPLKEEKRVGVWYQDGADSFHRYNEDGSMSASIGPPYSDKVQRVVTKVCDYCTAIDRDPRNPEAERRAWDAMLSEIAAVADVPIFGATENVP